MITRRQIQVFLKRHKMTVNGLAEAAKIRPFSLYRWLKKPDATVSLLTETKLIRAMEKVAHKYD